MHIVAAGNHLNSQVNPSVAACCTFRPSLARAFEQTYTNEYAGCNWLISKSHRSMFCCAFHFFCSIAQAHSNEQSWPAHIQLRTFPLTAMTRTGNPALSLETVQLLHQSSSSQATDFSECKSPFRCLSRFCLVGAILLLLLCKPVYVASRPTLATNDSVFGSA